MNVKTRKILHFALFIGISLVFQISSSACSSKNAIPTNTKYWFTLTPEDFQTNDQARAQEQIPFVIILPTYLPVDVSDVPTIRGQLKDTVAKENIHVYLFYVEKIGRTDTITIEESYNLIQRIPVGKNSVLYSINGVEILKEDFEIIAIFPDGAKGKPIPMFQFTWNSNGNHFEVKIQNHTIDESKKVVESMIVR
jgi:hypothetical protein